MKKHLTTGQHSILIEGDQLPITVRKHPSSRRIVIRYQPLTHSLSLTLPRYTPLKQGLHFIEEKRGWIASQLKERVRPVPFEDGSVIPFLGKQYQICHTGGRGIARLEDQMLLVPGEKEFTARRVRDWLKAQARAEITRLVQINADQLGHSVQRISIRDTSSHWGSCNHTGNLSFSWRLVLAPYEILDYVVCHEVAHLQELNHSPAFWNIVAKLCPHANASRRWLKQHGSILYTYG